MESQHYSVPMIGIQPGYSAAHILSYLRDAERDARNLLGNDGHRDLSQYIDWATTHLRTLGPAIKPGDLDGLITTRRYWTLLGMMSAGGTGVPNSLPSLIALELTQRAAALEVAHDELDIEMMKSKNINAGVLDTNIMMILGDQLDTYDWHAALGIGDQELLMVWIPISVVDELDRKKIDRNMMKIGGEKFSRRSRARRALRNIDRMLPEPASGHVVQLGDDPSRNRFEIRILMEEPGHIRLPSVDAEVVDQAVSLLALGGRVQIVT